MCAVVEQPSVVFLSSCGKHCLALEQLMSLIYTNMKKSNQCAQLAVQLSGFISFSCRLWYMPGEYVCNYGGPNQQYEIRLLHFQNQFSFTTKVQR